ncbi:MAG: SpoVA/SpoVAEb family sporulation membrane protein [Bacilli bacterium]|nr:SpoVA/SpoVAEb family sporulation membrane protein [Bacilli bacterium]
MNKEEYQKLIKAKKPKEPKLKNALIAFFTGGFMGFFCEILSKLLIVWLGIPKSFSYGIICFLLILCASFFTALGFFDNLIVKYKCGLIIPTTGFAHSVTSSALEYKNDGMITGLGSNFFKLAGSVILYGIVSAFFLCLLKVICYA